MLTAARLISGISSQGIHEDNHAKRCNYILLRNFKQKLYFCFISSWQYRLHKPLIMNHTKSQWNHKWHLKLKELSDTVKTLVYFATFTPLLCWSIWQQKKRKNRQILKYVVKSSDSSLFCFPFSVSLTVIRPFSVLRGGWKFR